MTEAIGWHGGATDRCRQIRRDYKIMKSAYSVLGIPGNASPDDVEAAYQRATEFYTPQRMAEDSNVALQFVDVREAYQVLRDAESRTAHDRKLASQLGQGASRKPLPVVTAPREKKPIGLLPIALVLAVAIFGTGYWMQAKREKARQEQAAQEAEAVRKEAAAEAERRAAEAIQKADRDRQDAAAARQEAMLRREADTSMMRLQNSQAQQRSQQMQIAEAERREAQRREYERRAEEQRAVMESQRRVALDRQRIRELCYQNYRKFDC
jgi:curved DNA-binding protein CbpA